MTGVRAAHPLPTGHAVVGSDWRDQIPRRYFLLAPTLIHWKETLVEGKHTPEALPVFCFLPSFSNRKFVQKNPPLTLRLTDVAA